MLPNPAAQELTAEQQGIQAVADAAALAKYNNKQKAKLKAAETRAKKKAEKTAGVLAVSETSSVQGAATNEILNCVFEQV